MKKIIIPILILSLLALCSCGSETSTTSTTSTLSTTQTTDEISTPTTEPAADKYADSKYLGKWYNAYSSSDVADFELLSDGTAIYNGTTECTWEESGEEILIHVTIDGEAKEMKGYFIISCEGFSCRATPENQHYLDSGEGELQLEIMLTENTCIDCIQK
jgi:hypothetical protein